MSNAPLTYGNAGAVAALRGEEPGEQDDPSGWISPENPQFGNLGLGGANEVSNEYAGQGASYQSVAAPNIGTPGLAQSWANTQDSQQSELDALGNLKAQANGTGPNYAAMATAPGLAQAQAANAALARSVGVGGRGALAARTAAMSNATQATQTSNANAQLQAQAQSKASDAYAQGVNQLQSQQQQQQQISLQGINAQAGINQQSQNLADMGQEGYMGLAQQTEAEQLQADTSAYNSQLNSNQQKNVATTQASAQQQQAEQSGAVAAGSAVLLALADPRTGASKLQGSPSATASGGGMGAAPAGSTPRTVSGANMAGNLQSGMRVGGYGGLMGAGAPQASSGPQMGSMMRQVTPQSPQGGLMGGAPGAPRPMMPQGRPMVPGLQGGPQARPPLGMGAGMPFGGLARTGARGGVIQQAPMGGGPRPMRPTLNAQGIGQIMSDERAKKVRPGGETEADRFLETMHPYAYSYRDSSNEPTDSPTGGKYLGIMAQNVERGPTGSTLVRDTPRGKALEGRALLSAMAAGEGRLHERVAALEAASAKNRKGAA